MLHIWLPYTFIVLFQVADKRVDDLIKTLMDQVQHITTSYSKALRKESKTNKRMWKEMKKLNKKIINQQTINHETDNFAKLVSYLNKLTTDKSQASKSNERKEDTVGLERKSRSKTPPPSTSKEAGLIKHQTHAPSTITETNSKQQLTLKKFSSPGRFRSWSRSGLRSRSRSRERSRRYRTRSSSRSSCSSSSVQSDSNQLNSSRRSRSKSYCKSRITKLHLSPAQNIDVYKKRPGSKRDYSSSSSCSSSSSSSPSQKRKNRTLSRPFSPQHTGKTFQTHNRQNSTCKTTHTVHQIRQGSNFLTKKTLTTVTSSVDYQGELNSFKNRLNRKISGSDDSDLELREIDLLVHDTNGKNVTRKRPNGDLNHPFYVHPEDGKLKYTRCTIIHVVMKG